MLSPVQVSHGTHSQLDRANTLDAGQLKIEYQTHNARVITFHGATRCALPTQNPPRVLGPVPFMLDPQGQHDRAESCVRPYAGRTPISARRTQPLTPGQRPHEHRHKCAGALSNEEREQ